MREKEKKRSLRDMNWCVRHHRPLSTYWPQLSHPFHLPLRKNSPFQGRTRRMPSFLGKSLASLGSDSLCIIPMAFQELASTLNLVFIASPKRIWGNLSHPPKLPTSIYVHPPQRLFSENDRSISPSPEDATFFFAYAPATIRFPSLRSQT